MKNRNILIYFIIPLLFILFNAKCKKVPLFAKEGATLIIMSDKSYLNTENDEATITVMGFNSGGEPIHDHTSVVLVTSLGVIEPSEIELIDGRGTAVFYSTDSGVAEIYARSGDIVSDVLEIKVGSAALESLNISADPANFESGGGESRIDVFAFDENGNLLSDIPTVLTSTSGSFDKGGVVYTNQNGKATDFITLYETATVTATSGEAEVSVDITVEEEEENELPVAGFTFSPTSPYYEETIYFNAGSSSDSDGYIVSYEWDFGDGKSARGKKVSHEYSWTGSEQEKTFSVMLKVKDDRGGTDYETQTITVQKREEE